MAKKIKQDYTNLIEELNKEETSPFDKPKDEGPKVDTQPKDEGEKNQEIGVATEIKDQTVIETLPAPIVPKVNVEEENRSQPPPKNEGTENKEGALGGDDLDKSLVGEQPKREPVKAGANSLTDIKELIQASLAANSNAKAINVYADENTLLRLESIESSLKGDPAIGSKSNRRVVLKLVTDFFWDSFGPEIKKREEKALRERLKKASA